MTTRGHVHLPGCLVLRLNVQTKPMIHAMQSLLRSLRQTEPRPTEPVRIQVELALNPSEPIIKTPVYWSMTADLYACQVAAPPGVERGSPPLLATLLLPFLPFRRGTASINTPSPRIIEVSHSTVALSFPLASCCSSVVSNTQHIYAHIQLWGVVVTVVVTQRQGRAQVQ